MVVLGGGMYRILVMDDEIYILNYLQELLQKNFSEELSVYKTNNSKEALSIMQSIHLDFALLDISMPIYSGFEIAEEILKVSKKCRIIFLTAMDNFDYIYKADKMARTKYLLKTETDTIIVDTIRTVIDEQNEELLIYQNLDLNLEKKCYLNHLVVQSMLRELLNGQLIKTIEDKIEKLKIEMPFDMCEEIFLVKMKIINDYFDKIVREHPIIITTYYKVMSDIIPEQYMFLLYEGGTEFYWLIQTKDENAKIEIIKSFFENFINAIYTVLNQNAVVVILQEQIKFTELKNEYIILKNKIAVEQIKDKHSIIRLAENNKLTNEIEDYINITQVDYQIQQMERLLNINDWTGFHKVLKKIESQHICMTSIHDLRSIQCYMRISLLLLEQIERYNIEYEISLKIGTYGLYYINDFNSWNDAFEYIQSVSQYIFELISNKCNNKNELVIAKIKSYIDNNLSSHITLAQIGSYINYNESYISRIFKQETGLNLFEYINSVRIEKSKELLITTDKTIQHISTEVGFDTPQYFSGVFKKVTGLTPGNYRLLKLRVNN